MGINARLRYAISWMLLRLVMTPLAWLSAGLTIANMGIAWFALWFSPELKQAETIRLLKSLDDE